MIAGRLSAFAIASDIRALAAPTGNQADEQLAAGTVAPNRFGAAVRLALRRHWIVVVFLGGAGLLLRFGA